MPGAEATAGARRQALSPAVRLRLVYRDESVFGSPLSERCEREMRRRFAVLYGYRQRYGLGRLVREAPRVLDRVMDQCLDGILGDSDRLDPRWLYPDPARVRPAMLRVERDLGEVLARIELPAALVGELAAWLGEWQAGAAEPAAPAPRRLWRAPRGGGEMIYEFEGKVPKLGDGTYVFEDVLKRALRGAGALAPVQPVAAPAATGVRFVGHACLQLGDGDRQLLVDPFLLPESGLYPDHWQPLSLARLGRPDAVLITHAHPDHFDLGTLLRCGADTPIYVPAVPRESVLSIDMSARLLELGFRRVYAVDPGQSWQVGAMVVRALPFHGEQPTVAEVRHPEVRNEGLTYLIEAGGQRVAALADAGRDGQGDIRTDAARAQARFGPADLVFGGYRGFALYPVQYAFSSVARYLPFVPATGWGVRQQIMCDADDLIDVGETWGARQVIPYAAGGAPWFWLLGLGPCLDGSASDCVSTDPLPESVVEAARRRGFNREDGALASPLGVRPLRVGESIALGD